jgi:hypothetical protein
MIVVQVDGVPKARATLAAVAGGCAAAAELALEIGSPLPYAYGIEYGRDRSGRLRRRAGPAYMLTSALDEATDRLGDRLAEALPRGASGTRAALIAQAGEIRDVAKGRTPVRTGRLRASIQVAFGGG